MKKVTEIKCDSYSKALSEILNQMSINEKTKVIIYCNSADLLRSIINQIWELKICFIPIVNIDDNFAKYAPIVYSSSEFNPSNYTSILCLEKQFDFVKEYEGELFILKHNQHRDIHEEKDHNSINMNQDRDFSNRNSRSYQSSRPYPSSPSSQRMGEQRPYNNNKFNRDRESYPNENSPQYNRVKRFTSTYCLIKPLAVKEGKAWDIIKYIESKGFIIAFCTRKKYGKHIFEELYAEHKDKPFYNDLCQAMSSTHMLFVALLYELEKGPSAIDLLVKITGKSAFPEECEQESIRYMFATDERNSELNVIHRPTSEEEYIREHIILQGKRPLI